MCFPQQRLLQSFLFRIRSHIYLPDNTTNTRRPQSIPSPSECRIFGTFGPFRTFHPSLHESVAEICSPLKKQNIEIAADQYEHLLNLDFANYSKGEDSLKVGVQIFIIPLFLVL